MEMKSSKREQELYGNNNHIFGKVYHEYIAYFRRIYESLTYIKQETVGFHIYLFSLAREEEEGQSEKTTQHHLRVLSLI